MSLASFAKVGQYSFYNYTEHQKKLITSAERHSLKSITSKVRYLDTKLALAILIKHI